MAVPTKALEAVPHWNRGFFHSGTVWVKQRQKSTKGAVEGALALHHNTCTMEYIEVKCSTNTP